MIKLYEKNTGINTWMKVIFLTEVLVNYGPDFLKFLPYHQKKKKKGKNLELFKHIFET